MPNETPETGNTTRPTVAVVHEQTQQLSAMVMELKTTLTSVQELQVLTLTHLENRVSELEKTTLDLGLRLGAQSDTLLLLMRREHADQSVLNELRDGQLATFRNVREVVDSIGELRSMVSAGLRPQARPQVPTADELSPEILNEIGWKPPREPQPEPERRAPSSNMVPPVPRSSHFQRMDGNLLDQNRPEGNRRPTPPRASISETPGGFTRRPEA